ncbi:MAG: PAS domain-containing protein [Proteobacteria bacterium]|nr:PAS domain-containing protein [Pseudomonadota bacterium]
MNDNALVIVDRSGTIRHWNACAETWFGYSAEAALGRTLDLIVPSDFQAEHWKGFHRAVERGVADSDGRAASFPVQCSAGDVTVFRGALTLLRDVERHVIGAAVVFEPSA